MPVKIIGMIGVAPPSSKASLHVIEGGDHSFHTPKSAYVPDAETYARIAAEAVEWLSEKTK